MTCRVDAPRTEGSCGRMQGLFAGFRRTQGGHPGGLLLVWNLAGAHLPIQYRLSMKQTENRQLHHGEFFNSRTSSHTPIEL